MVTNTYYERLRNYIQLCYICGKYNVSCSPKMYDKMIKCIPLQMINLVK